MTSEASEPKRGDQAAPDALTPTTAQDAPATEPPAADDAATDAGETPTPPRGSASGRVALVLALLALILLAAGGGAGYWAWSQFRHTMDMQAATLAQLRETLDSKASESSLADLDQQTRQLDAQQQAQSHALKSLNQALQQSQVLNQRDQRGWTVSEVEYLMRIARYRLDLLHDVHGAVAALTQADQRLAHLGDPDLLPVRQALAAEIQSLRDYQAPDKVGILLQLNQILSHIVLPTPLGTALLDRGDATATPVHAETTKKPGGFRGFIEAVWHSISEHVSIRHYPQRVNDLAVITTQAQAAQSLYLYLENARAAVLAGDNGAYHQALAHVMDALHQGDGDQALRSGLLSTLDKLNAVDLAPPLPSLGEALKRLRHLAAAAPAGGPSA